MGSSDKGTGVVDCSVGSIVWVRRRNGSWWPGKILGPDELSAAHLMSPRSGTPVKLLGREDASVDWYNLEKSKRVKAFRCGEFDDCIEKAESSQGIPPKKREKYARREDAILHALELEKQLLEKKYGKLVCSSNGKSSNSSDALKKELATTSDCSASNNGRPVQPKSHQLSKRPDPLLEDKNMVRSLCAQKVKEGNQLSGDDDNSEIIPRMRGLQDFGLKIAPAKQKLSSSTLDGSRRTAFDSNAHLLPSAGLGPGNTVHSNGKNALDKRKKTHEDLVEESPAKRRDRRRPLVQVLQSSSKLPVSQSLEPDSGDISMSGEEQTGAICREKKGRYIYLPDESGDCFENKEMYSDQMEMSPSRFEKGAPHSATLTEDNTSGSMEDTETDSSGTDFLASDTDEEMMALSDVVTTELEPKSMGKSQVEAEHGSTSSEEPDDLPLAGDDMSHLCPRDSVSETVGGVSKWQLKGKRNTRSFTRRSTDITDVKVSKGSIYGTNLEEDGSNGYYETDAIEKNFRSRVSGYEYRGHQVISKSASRALDSISRNAISWEDSSWNDQPTLRGFWEDSSNCFDPVFVGRHHFAGRMKSSLVDVDLKVQSGYQREHVPMISLMSKLNGQAIVGHPIQIEALENGSSDILLSAVDAAMSDKDTAVPPVWRTARRTANFRVPRPHPSTALGGDETVERFRYFNQDRKAQFKKSSVGSSGHKPGTMRKGLSHVSRPPISRNFQRKPPKKISLSSNQKTRTLSSIGTERKNINDAKHGGSTYQVDGLIKTESGPPAVACIPVKLVFSRLYEELVGRHQ